MYEYISRSMYTDHSPKKKEGAVINLQNVSFQADLNRNALLLVNDLLVKEPAYLRIQPFVRRY